MLKKLLNGRLPFGAKLVGFSGWLPRLQRHIHKLSGEKMHTIQAPPPLFFFLESHAVSHFFSFLILLLVLAFLWKVIFTRVWLDDVAKRAIKFPNSLCYSTHTTG
jgi:hypothetical protein